MIPNNKCPSESNSRRTSNDSKLLPKTEPTPTNDRDIVGHIDSNHQQHHVRDEVEEVQPKVDSERKDKPQIFNIKYVVPSNLIIREHSSQQQNTDEPIESFHESPKGMDCMRLVMH